MRRPVGDHTYDSREAEDDFGSSHQQQEDGANMEAQPAEVPRERRDFEICAICGKDLVSLNTRSVGNFFMDYDCARRVNLVLDAITDHAIKAVISGIQVQKFTLRQALLRVGIRHLDVKELTTLETLLGPTVKQQRP